MRFQVWNGKDSVGDLIELALEIDAAHINTSGITITRHITFLILANITVLDIITKIAVVTSVAIKAVIAMFIIFVVALVFSLCLINIPYYASYYYD